VLVPVYRHSVFRTLRNFSPPARKGLKVRMDMAGQTPQQQAHAPRRCQIVITGISPSSLLASSSSRPKPFLRRTLFRVGGHYYFTFQLFYLFRTRHSPESWLPCRLLRRFRNFLKNILAVNFLDLSPSRQLFFLLNPQVQANHSRGFVVCTALRRLPVNSSTAPPTSSFAP